MAVTVLLAFMVMVSGFAEPERSPDQLSNSHPVSGLAVKVTTVPSLYVPPEGFRFTLPDPEVLTVKSYCVPLIGPI